MPSDNSWSVVFTEDERHLADYELSQIINRNLILLEDEEPQGCFDLMGNHFRIGEIEIYVYMDGDDQLQIDTLVLAGGRKLSRRVINRIYLQESSDVLLHISGCGDHESLYGKLHDLPYTMEKRIEMCEKALEVEQRRIGRYRESSISNTNDMNRLIKSHNDLIDRHSSLKAMCVSMYFLIATIFAIDIIAFIIHKLK